MVEGHTDDVPFQNEVLQGNWDFKCKKSYICSWSPSK
jgi:hypothetical protein